MTNPTCAVDLDAAVTRIAVDLHEGHVVWPSLRRCEDALREAMKLAVAAERERLRDKLALNIKLIPVETANEAILRQKIIDDVLSLLTPEGGQ